jgi:hypothetical protein
MLSKPLNDLISRRALGDCGSCSGQRVVRTGGRRTSRACVRSSCALLRRLHPCQHLWRHWNTVRLQDAGDLIGGTSRRARQSRQRGISSDFLVLKSSYFEDRRDEYIDRMREVSKSGAWTEWTVFFLEALEA